MKFFADEDALKEIGDKLSRVIDEKNSEPDFENAEADVSSAPEPGSTVPDTRHPDLPTSPETGADLDKLPNLGGDLPTFHPTDTNQTVNQKEGDVEILADVIKDLSKSVKELVEKLDQEITTMVVPGRAALDEGKEETQDGSDFGFRPVSTERRKSMELEKNPRMKKAGSPEAESTKPSSLPELLGAPDSSTVEGSKDYATSGGQTSESEMSAQTDEGKHSSLGALLYVNSAEDLRRSRLARLGYSVSEAPRTGKLETRQVPRISVEATKQLWDLAEKKASDMAKLKRAQFKKAMELAFLAQERGILQSPLLDTLTAALVEHDVPNAAQIAADVLSGANTENFRAACEQAEKYMDMTDREFLAVAATVKKAPPLNAPSRVPTTSVADELENGNVNLQASSGAQSHTKNIRDILRAGAPRPLTRV